MDEQEMGRPSLEKDQDECRKKLSNGTNCEMKGEEQKLGDWSRKDVQQETCRVSMVQKNTGGKHLKAEEAVTEGKHCKSRSSSEV